MTNHWVDLKNSDLVIVMGGNAAEAHPCGFKWVIEAKKDRKARLIVVDPRFTRSAAVSDFYAPIRAGQRHRLPRRRHQLPAVEGQDPSRLRQELHQRRLPDRRRLQVRGRPVLRLQRRKAQLRQGHLEVPDGQGRLRHGRSDPGGARTASSS
jgi:hypothetical protein